MMSYIKIQKTASLAILGAVVVNSPKLALANPDEEAEAMDTVVVSATRSERGSKTVPSAVASIGAEKLAFAIHTFTVQAT